MLVQNCSRTLVRKSRGCVFIGCAIIEGVFIEVRFYRVRNYRGCAFIAQPFLMTTRKKNTSPSSASEARAKKTS